MYNQPEVALEHYNLELKQMIKGRGMYICETSEGTKGLMPFNGSAERGLVLHTMLAALMENGFEAEQIMLTADGAVVAADDSETTYILKTIYKGRECNPDCIEDVTAAMELLARFHFASPSVELPDYMRQTIEDEIEGYERHNRELVKVKNYIRGRKKKNELEMKLLKEYQHFYIDATRAVEKMRGLEMDSCECGWRHNGFNYHNVVKNGSEYVLTNYEASDCGVLMTDVAGFMRKILEKNGWNIKMGQKMLEAYEKIRPFKGQERQMLGYMLLYPEKFWKLSNHYYNSHKAWVSQRYVEKLEHIACQDAARKEFLEKIF